MDAFLIDRWQEGADGTCLWHTRHFADVRTIVAVLAIGGMIDHKQITIAPLGRILRDAFAVTIAGMAVKT